MGRVSEPSTVILIVQSTQTKKDLRGKFGDLLEEFRKEEVNGNITLHFSQGYLAKIHSTKVD
jgi:hypothetical protein